jgi:hypothetical protein
VVFIRVEGLDQNRFLLRNLDNKLFRLSGEGLSGSDGGWQPGIACLVNTAWGGVAVK